VLIEEHLTLRLVRLKSSEEWSPKREGLVFLIFKAGAGEYVADHASVQIQAGDILILNEDKRGKLRTFRNEEIAFWSFSLRLEHLFPLFAGTEISFLQDVMGGLKNSKLLPASSSLAVQCHRLIEEVPPQFNLDHRGQLLRVTAAILADEFKGAYHQRLGFVRTEKRVVQVFEALSADELLNLSVSELAEKFGCSRRHLNRLFHQNFGLSVGALKMEMRLMKAAACLRNGQTKVIIVAEQCGFNHLGLFNTCFKKRFQTTPGQWRRMIAERPSLLTGNPGVPMLSNKPDETRVLPDVPDATVKAAQGVAISAAIQKKIAKEMREHGPFQVRA
jgi:AraC-like DNA-binding protein